MKNTMKEMLCPAVSMLLLTACLCGCGEVEMTIQNAESETTGMPGFQSFDRENMPENFSPKQGMEISEENIAALIQTAYDYVLSESDLWYIGEVTDADILKELTQNFGNAGNQNRKNGFGGNGNMPKRNGDGNGQFSGQGNNIRPGNLGNGFGSCILMISALEGSEISAEAVLAAVQEDAEAMGYSASDVTLTEQQKETVHTQTGYEPTLVVRIGMAMPDIRKGAE